jgi:hypothetical protein
LLVRYMGCRQPIIKGRWVICSIEYIFSIYPNNATHGPMRFRRRFCMVWVSMMTISTRRLIASLNLDSRLLRNALLLYESLHMEQGRSYVGANLGRGPPKIWCILHYFCWADPKRLSFPAKLGLLCCLARP